jgi:hypothetical protein
MRLIKRYVVTVTSFLSAFFLVHSVLAQTAIDAKTSNKQTAPSQKLRTVPARPASLKKRITEAQAVKIVGDRAEVKSWKQEVAKAWTKERPVKAFIELDRKEKGEYVVHVFEVVPDDPESSHTATFNWYHVNDRTGAVRKEF